ncbi:hypothetical protein HUU40_18685 [candidate division KSB1 bacterium]|nr:hypothetical protein [candidate division KSB1 bacterium]
MIETESSNFIIAIIFTTAMIALVVGMFGYHLIVSGKKLHKAQRLAEAALEFTPSFMTIVFDERYRVAEVKVQNPAVADHFRNALLHKNIEELNFLPPALRIHHDSAAGHPEPGDLRAPLKMPAGEVIYLEWDMRQSAENTDFHIAWGFDITNELLHTQRKLRVLSAASSEGEERERKRIAEDLHDRIGEILITSSRLLDDLKKKSASPDIRQGLEELDRTIEKFTKGTRTLISDLVPPILYNVGFAPAIEALAVDFKRQYHLAIQLDDGWQEAPVNQEIAIFLYKAVREFIHNAIKHGGADEILISLSREDHQLAVTVEDNGSGFAAEENHFALNTDSGFGLFNVKNRAEYYQGGLEIDNSTKLGGGQIKVWVSQGKADGVQIIDN